MCVCVIAPHVLIWTTACQSVFEFTFILCDGEHKPVWEWTNVFELVFVCEIETTACSRWCDLKYTGKKQSNVRPAIHLSHASANQHSTLGETHMCERAVHENIFRLTPREESICLSSLHLPKKFGRKFFSWLLIWPRLLCLPPETDVHTQCQTAGGWGRTKEGVLNCK